MPEEPRPPAGILLSRHVVSIDVAAGEGAFTYVARPEFVNRHGSVQGGFLAAMLDSATGYTLISCLGENETAVTRTLTVEFLRPAMQGLLHVRAKIVSRTATHAEVTGELSDGQGKTLATAAASLRILQRQKP